LLATTKLLPGSRRSQVLGKETLKTLASLFPGRDQVEGGVASLSRVSRSADSTTKILLELSDGLKVETVIIPWKGGRSTACLSSQVGCEQGNESLVLCCQELIRFQGCKFCATGRMGKLRSLSSDEILAQMFFAKKICRQQSLPDVTNVVFMGMGEPADNANAVRRAIPILASRDHFHLAASKITVSTVAPNQLAFDLFADLPCVLAWSVHAVSDPLRKRLVPTSRDKMTTLRQRLIDALRCRPPNPRTVMLEVALIKDVNESLDHAKDLAKCAKVIMDEVDGMKLIVNLIPFNDSGQKYFERPSGEQVEQFQRLLWSRGVYVHIRCTRGDDELAACGQLVTSSEQT